MNALLLRRIYSEIYEQPQRISDIKKNSTEYDSGSYTLSYIKIHYLVKLSRYLCAKWQLLWEQHQATMETREALHV